MEPVIVLNILQSMRMLTRGMVVLKERCIDGIEVDVDRCKALLDQSLVLATPLATLIGYSKAAYLSRRRWSRRETSEMSSKKKAF
ncbi:hypothetical protein ACOJBO_11300 [Rhizobium beringeri]